MKKLFKNIAKTAKTAAINCQTSLAAFHRRAVCGRKDKARQNRISLLLALVVAADLWRCHYSIVWWQNNQLEADYAANPLGLYVDALFVLFALLNLAAAALPLWDVFIRGRRAESAMPSASRREPV